MKHRLHIVSGSDWTHASSLLQLLESIHHYEPSVTTTVYDLGLTDGQRRKIASSMRNGVLKTFEYANYPRHFDISINAGEYAWKPAIVAAELAASLGDVCWMDAGNVLLRPLRHLRHELRWKGFFARPSSGYVPDWTHPLMLRYLELPTNWGARLLNLSAACVAFSSRHERAIAVAQEWARLAAIKDCIAPLGSSRANHRQDQALLTVLAYKSGIIRRPSHRDLFRRDEFATQRDLPPEDDVRDLCGGAVASYEEREEVKQRQAGA